MTRFGWYAMRVTWLFNWLSLEENNLGVKNASQIAIDSAYLSFDGEGNFLLNLSGPYILETKGAMDEVKL